MHQACEDLATSGVARPPVLPIDPSQFQRRLTVAALGLLLVVLLGFVLYVCASILQPLFIAGLLVYLILPVHQRLVRWRVPSAVAYLLILAAAEAAFRVGFESPSPFSREFRPMFRAPPRPDVAALQIEVQPAASLGFPLLVSVR